MSRKVVHLVRHGEVANPNHVVYGNLAGFHLSSLGVTQTQQSANHLADLPVDSIIASPLARARETATAIARAHSLEVSVDDRLTESGQFPHWTGNTWEDVPALFPGELETYLNDASNAGNGETVVEIAKRVASVIDDQLESGSENVVIVSHQDPIQAARLLLVGRDLSELRLDPPAHAEVVSMQKTSGSVWEEFATWSPT